jgi:glutathione S-transferase
MVKLCGFRLSNYYNKVRIVLLEKGIAHQEENIFFSQDEGFRKRSPMGKVPFLETDNGVLCESAVICEYLEDAYPDKPLLPRDPLQRAKTREFLQVLELHIELVARRLYGEVLFGQKVSDEVKKEVARDLEKGVRALKQLAQFAPYAVGSEFTLADCAAGLHFPLVAMATKAVLGHDCLESIPQVGEYLKLVTSRPSFQQVNADFRSAFAAHQAAQKSATS